MNTETKTCQNCKNQFVIELEDFNFYEKIKVPPPTWCPECRMQRRMTWRNERSLYKRKCEATGKDVITCFSTSSRIHVYDRDYWWSDQWDPLSFGREYDFSKPFFTQFGELLERFPMPSLFNSRCTNSEYGNHNGELKNSYLIFATWGGEDIMYGAKVHSCRNSLDMLASQDAELCYEVVNSTKLYNSAFIENSENCSDSYFLYECRGCSRCFGCVNLRNKSYCIFNQPYAKEEYFEKLKEFNLGSWRELQGIREKFAEAKSRSLRKYARIYNCQNVTGDNLTNVSNSKYCFDLTADVRDCKWAINGGFKMTDSYDGYGIGANAELLYEAVDTGADGSRFYFDIFVWGGSSVCYSYASHGCQDCFGCIGLRQKSYCILNKQYTKEEYEKLVPKIIAHLNEMPYVDAKGRIYKYGEFFPPELSPFIYNETIAQEYLPLTEEEVVRLGYKWKNLEGRHYEITKQSLDLPDHIRDVPDSILKEVIGCAHQGKCTEQCTTAFKIIPPELQFYRKMNLPLPRLCSNCRHYERLKQRNPLKLWRRTCQCAGAGSERNLYANTVSHRHGQNHCPNEFETSYAPERPEVVYCEACYNAEVV